MKKGRPREGDLPETTALAGKACSGTQVSCVKGPFLSVSPYLQAVILKTGHALESPQGLFNTAPEAPPPGVSEFGSQHRLGGVQEFQCLTSPR